MEYVFVSLSLVKGIKEKYPNSIVDMYTDRPEVASLSPYIDNIAPEKDYHKTLNYDLYYLLRIHNSDIQKKICYMER